MQAGTPAGTRLRAENIVKTYASNGVVANDGVSLSLEVGEIHAVVGENGAGKSTLMKVLHGEERPDSGRILVGGREVQIASPMVARSLGIGMVHQEFKLFPSLTVAENVVLGDEPRRGGLFFNRGRANARVAELSSEYGLEIDPQARVERLSVGQKQRLEILKMLYQGATVLILDEPTAVLVRQEVDALFQTLRRLAAAGRSVVLITHKIPEVKEISDRVSIMRAGRIVVTRPTGELSESEICRFMIGRDLETTVGRRRGIGEGPAVLQVRQVSLRERNARAPLLEGIEFEVHAGEIFGIAGVAGNGQAELVEVLFGLRAISSGRITVGSTDIRGLGPGRLRRHAVAYIPGERAVRGAALQGTIWENLAADRLGDFRKVLLLDFQAIREFSDEQIRKFSIRSAHWKLPAQSLSGGNLQKLVLSRELRREVDVLLVEEPARGLDIQSADQVFREILRMRAQGSAVVLVSSDLNELMRLADRIAVMYRGRIQAILDNTEGLSSYQIGEYMMGLRTA